MRAVEPPPLRRRALILPGLAAFAAFLALIGLGTWQLVRKAEKEALLAKVSDRLAAAPVPLPTRAEWPQLDRGRDEFRRVKFSAAFMHDREALVYGAASGLRAGGSAGPGYDVFAPARLADGSIVMVDRGFVPEDRKDPAARASGQVAGPVEIIGVMRWPEAPAVYTPSADPAKNMWFVRDSDAIAAAKGMQAAPFYVELEAPVPPGGWPQPARLQPNLLNNHLQYAATWYGLALALAAVFTAWAFRQRR